MPCELWSTLETNREIFPVFDHSKARGFYRLSSRPRTNTTHSTLSNKKLLGEIKPDVLSRCKFPFLGQGLGFTIYMSNSSTADAAMHRVSLCTSLSEKIRQPIVNTLHLHVIKLLNSEVTAEISIIPPSWLPPNG